MTEPRKKVLHITSCHFSHDSRIVYRECLTLSKIYDLKVIIPEPDKDWINKLDMIGIPKIRSPFWRIVLIHPLIFFKAFIRNVDIYHFHDPELIPLGLVLKIFRKNVVFDIHENIEEHIKSMKKTGFLFKGVYHYLHILSKKYFHIILAEESYRKYYIQGEKATHLEVIQNFPPQVFFKKFCVTHRSQLGGNDIFYIGNVSINRAIDVIIRSIAMLRNKIPDVRVHIFGQLNIPFSDLEKLPCYEDVKDILIFYHRTRPDIAYEMAKNCKVGLAILKPLGNYLGSYTTKMFEYMSVGMPVITSNFPLYKDVIEKNNVGLCVNPEEPKEISDALFQILSNAKLADEMGENGIKSIESNYNWELEANKLTEFYKFILD